MQCGPQGCDFLSLRLQKFGHLFKGRSRGPRFHRLQKPVPLAFREVHRLLPERGTLRITSTRTTSTASIPVLRNFPNIEFRIITFARALAFSWRVGRPSPLCPFLERASFRVDHAPKTKIPPPGLFRRWDSRIARYDSRVFRSRRQKTDTYSRYNRGKPAWSSGRRKSRDKSTETGFRSQCGNYLEVKNRVTPPPESDPGNRRTDEPCGEALRLEPVSYKLSFDRGLQRKSRLESNNGMFRGSFRRGNGCVFW